MTAEPIQRIKHPSLGKGTIQFISSPTHVRVLFDGGLEINVQASTLALEDGTPYRGSSSPSSKKSTREVAESKEPARKLALSKSAYAKNQKLSNAIDAINCLRFGLVHPAAVEAITVGMSDIRQTIDEDLAALREKNCARALIIEADWGVGKTHALTMARLLAAKHGFWVTGTEISEQHGFATPGELGASLYDKLCLPGEWLGGGLESCIEKFCAEPSLRLKMHPARFPMLRPALLAAYDAHCAGMSAIPEVMAFLTKELPRTRFSGELGPLGSGYTGGPAWPGKLDEQADQFALKLAELARLCTVINNAPGLLVIVDELDLEPLHFRTLRNRLIAQRCASSINALIGTTDCPIYFILSTTNPVYPNPVTHVKKAQRLCIESLNEDEVRQLAERIVGLYRQTYTFTFPNSAKAECEKLVHSAIINALPNRNLVRALVDLLDTYNWQVA